MENQNKDLNQEQKQNNKNISQTYDGVESLNNSQELDLETLEEVDGAGCCGQLGPCSSYCWPELTDAPIA